MSATLIKYVCALRKQTKIKQKQKNAQRFFKPKWNLESLQSMRNVGGRVLSTIYLQFLQLLFFISTVAEDWGIERKLYRQGERKVKKKERGGGVGINITPARGHCFFGKICPWRMEFLISAVLFYLSITSQTALCYSCGKNVESVLKFTRQPGGQSDIDPTFRHFCLAPSSGWSKRCNKRSFYMITNQLPFFWRGVNRRQEVGHHLSTQRRP